MKNFSLNIIAVLFFLCIGLIRAETISADYQISCGLEASVNCACDQCPNPSGYTCPGSPPSQCLRIGCYCDPDVDGDGDGIRGACLRNISNPTWNSCNGGTPPASPPPGSTPPPSPPPGSCGSCSTCGAATSGECAMLNGVCSKAGYCANGGGFTGCRIWDPAAVNVTVGQTKAVVISAFSYGDIVLGYNGTVLNPSIFSSYPLGINMCCSQRFGSFGETVYVTGVKPGIGWLSNRYGTSGNNDTDFCTNLLRVNVTANPTLPTIYLKANGLEGSQVLPSGTDVVLEWQATNVDSCTASGGWSGSKVTAGTEFDPNITTNTSYVLDCTGPNGNVSASADISIVGNDPLPFLSLSVNGSTAPVAYTFPFVGSQSNVVVRWTSLNATSCVGSSIPSPNSVAMGCNVGYWYWMCPYLASNPQIWANYWDKSQSRLVNGLLGFRSWDTTYSMTCTGLGGSTTKQIQVITTPPNTQCTLPQPQDPAPPVCAMNPPTQNGSVTWTWPAVRNANQYSVEIVDATNGLILIDPATGDPYAPVGFVDGQINYSCRLNQTPADLCSLTTVLPPGSYRSRIAARSSTNVCTPSSFATYPALVDPGITVDLCPAVSWWQSGDGSIFTQGNLQSIIPASCVAPTCINTLIQDGGGIPGIAIGGASGALQTGTGTVSSKDWFAKSPMNGRIPDYDSFVSLIPASIVSTIPPLGAGTTCNGADFNSGGSSSGGYSWYRHPRDLAINGDVNLNAGRKVILFVDGNLTINGKISYNPANSYFMPIVKGNITVGSTVTTPKGTPTLTGIFYCDGHFDSGAGAVPLSVLGSVVAKGGVTLQRDLGGIGNRDASAENFTISPDLMLNYPGALSFKRPIWREVAP